MKLIFSKGILCFLFFICSANFFCQTYPVQATTILVPPFSGYLQDFAGAQGEKLKLLLVLNDFSKPSYNVKIKFKLVGQNISIQSKPFYYYGPVTLYPGVPLEISGDDLAQLLSDNNLNYSGINFNDYQQRKVLPEGFYTFCFTVYDNDNSILIPVAQEACAFAWMTYSDPPFLNLPMCNSVVPAQGGINNNGMANGPQQITFNWTMNNAGSPASITNTEFTFELFEIFPAGQNPNNSVQTTTPIYTVTTQSTLLNYGITEPPLQIGREYCWRVKAKDVNGYDYFRNNGYSLVCKFSYGTATGLLGNSVQLALDAQPIRYNAAKFSWTPNTIFSSYRVEYRKTGNSSFYWFGLNSANSGSVASDLEAQTEYEARLRGVFANGDTGVWSNIVNFTTPPQTPINCNDQSPAPGMQNFVALTSMQPNTKLQIGQFEMRVTSLSATTSPTGQYSGYGHVTMFGFLNVHVHFTNISVGTDFIVYQGEVEAVTEGIANWVNQNLADQFGGNNTGDVVTGNTTSDETVNFVITGITIDTTGTGATITITGANGQTETYAVFDLPVTIQGSDGTIWYIDENGESGPAAQQNFMPPLNTAALDVLSIKGIVNFSAYSKQFYGFDSWQPIFGGLTHLESEYQELSDSAKTISYRVPQKSIRASGFDKTNISFSLTDPKIKKDSVLFVSGKGTRFLTQKTGNDCKLKLVGSPANDATEVYALYKDSLGKLHSLGKLKMPAYEMVTKNIVIVPVKIGGQTPLIDSITIKNKLNSYYKASCIKFNLKRDAVFTDDDWDLNGDKKMDVGNSNFFSQYTAEMKKLNQVYRDQRGRDPEKVYLFVLPEASQQGVAGDMPRGKQFGYIFSNVVSTGEAMAKTTSHEIAHGLFKLIHTFDPTIGLSQGVSNNLLDYSNDTCLYKYQWDQLHDPSTLSAMFDADGEGMNIMSAGFLPYDFLNDDNNTFTFLTPAGSYLTLNKEVIRNATFKWGIPEWKYTGVAPGVLIGFTYRKNVTDSVYYVADIDGSGATFGGYINQQNPSEKFPLTAVVDFYDKHIVIGYPKQGGFVLNKILVKGNLPSYLTQQNGPLINERSFPIKPFTADQDNILKSAIWDNTVCKTCFGDAQTQINPDYIKLAHSHEGKPEYFRILKIVEIASSYPNAFELFTRDFDNWDDYGIGDVTNDVTGMYAYWDKRMETLSPTYNLWKQNPQEFYSVFIDTLKNFSSSLSVNKDLLLVQGLAEKDAFKVSTALKYHTQNELRELSVETKLLAMSILIESPNPDDEQYETAIVSLLKYVKPAQADDMLNGINGTNKVNANKILLRQLVSGIDDSFMGMGGDNYKNLMNAFIRLCAYYTPFKNKIKDLKEEEFAQRYCEFNYTSIWRRCADALSANPEVAAIYNTFDISDVSFKTVAEFAHTDGKVTVYQKKCKQGFGCEDIMPYQTFEPFEPIYFTNKTELSMLSDFGGQGGAWLPAIVLKYAEDKANNETAGDVIKANNETAGDVINAAVDAASLACGIGELKVAISAMRRAMIIMDIATTSLSLYDNVTDNSITGNGDMQAFLTTLNALNAGVGLSNIKPTTSTKFEDAYALSKGAGIKTGAGMAAKYTELADNTDKIVNQWNSLSMTTRGKTRMLIERGIADAVASGNNGLANKLAAVMKKITEAAQNAGASFANCFNWFNDASKFNILPGPNNTKIFKANGAQIAHTLPDGAFVLDAEVQLAAAEGKIEDVIEGAKFRRADLGPDFIEDLLIIKKADGTVQCIRGACFVAGTKVRTKNGMVNIEKIKAKDSVLSFDPEKGKSVFQTVKNTFSKTVNKFVKVFTEKDTIVCTPNHPFLEAHNNWVEAEQLKKGLRVKLAAGLLATILNVVAFDSIGTVYNFEVENTHTYCVGKSGIVVHNDCKKIEEFCNQLSDKNLAADLAKDLNADQELLAKMGMGDLSVQGWEVLRVAERNTLRANINALKKLSIAMNNSNLANVYTKQNWIDMCKLHGRCGHAGQTIETILENGQTIAEEIAASLPFDKFMEAVNQLGNNKGIPGTENVLKELCCNTNKKFKGAEWALRFTEERNLWDQIDEFEQVVSTNGVTRRIDLKLVSGKRLELKSWKNWYSWSDQSFIDEFVKDLMQEDIGNIKWRFDKRGNFGDMVWLRDKVETALKNNRNNIDVQFSYSPSLLTKKNLLFGSQTALTNESIANFLNLHFQSVFIY
jgi:hypothetical protein